MRPVTKKNSVHVHVSACVLAVLACISAAYAQKRAFMPDDLFRLKRIESFTLSPDGAMVAYPVMSYTRPGNEKQVDLFLVSSDGGPPKQLTTSDGYNGNPCWGPQARMLAFVSDRRGQRQIFAIPMDGGEAMQISRLQHGVEDFLWSPDGKYFAVAQQIPDSADTGIREYTGSPASAPGIKQRILIMPSSGGSHWNPVHDRHIVPVLSGRHRDFDFSPDGRRLCFTGRVDTASTRREGGHVFIATTAGTHVRKISFSPGNKSAPRFSPDGRYVCYLAMPYVKGPAGQCELMLFDRNTGSTENLTREFDLDVQEAVWANSSEKIVFTASDQGRMVVFSIELKKKKIRGLIHSGYNSCLAVSPRDGNLFYCCTTSTLPAEIMVSNEYGENTFGLTFTNQIFLDSVSMNDMEDFWYKTYDGKTVHGLMVKPYSFRPDSVYPCIVLVQGLPHRGWYDRFSYFINPQVFAAEGFAVVMLNLRGSKGYGAEFSEGLNGDWTGAAYKDLIAGIDDIVRKYSYIDSRNISAAGSFYGGVLAAWAAMHSDVFKTVVCHSPIANMMSFFGTSTGRNLLVSEFGSKPYENSKKYDKTSLVRTRPEYPTPVFITQGAAGTVSDTNQGFEFLSMLDYFKVPSKLVVFDRGSTELSLPRDVSRWYYEVFRWIDSHSTKD